MALLFLLILIVAFDFFTIHIQGFQISQQPNSYAIHAREYQVPSPCRKNRSSSSSCLYSKVTDTTGQGFGKVDEKTKVQKDQSDHINTMNADQVKQLLIELLPRMTGTSEEFRLVEKYVNALEDKYVPPQTLDFLNLAMAGEWQFLFTTNQLGRPSPSLRLTELVQRVEANGFNGVLVNQAMWNLADEGAVFDVNGSFASTISYNINQGARMTMDQDHDLTIKLGRGSKVPSDPQSLLGLIHRAMPVEMFDATNLAIDTTYLDTDIRIVRFTGSRHEGVRNIFMRKGAMEINPNL